MAYRRLLLIVLLSAGVTACVNVPNVSTFASSVAAVTSATTTMISADRSLCDNINATVAELQELPKIGDIGATAECRTLNGALDAIAGVNTILDNYGKALGNIAQGTFVNYDSDVTALQGVFSSLPKQWQPTAAQSSALSGLAGWVASLVTEEKREKAIHDAMVGNDDVMAGNFHDVVGLLSRLVSQYSEAEAQRAQIARDVLGLVGKEYGSAEPLAVAEMNTRLAGSTKVGASQAMAVKQYQAALITMNTAFEAVRKKPTAKELLSDVRAFATQAKAVYQSFTKAFPIT
jgi:hypothetical protein